MSEEQSLKQKTAKGLFWGGLSSSIQQLLGLIIGIIVTRMLSRADYGMIGMLAIFSSIASILQESGFIAALAIRTKVSDKELQCCLLVQHTMQHGTLWAALSLRSAYCPLL